MLVIKIKHSLVVVATRLIAQRQKVVHCLLDISLIDIGSLVLVLKLIAVLLIVNLAKCV